MYEKKVYLLEKAVIVKSLTTDFSAYVCAFYFLKWGAKRKGGARTPRTPPEYAPGKTQP